VAGIEVNSSHAPDDDPTLIGATGRNDCERVKSIRTDSAVLIPARRSDVQIVGPPSPVALHRAVSRCLGGVEDSSFAAGVSRLTLAAKGTRRSLNALGLVRETASLDPRALWHYASSRSMRD
jgi:hypothetical protein